MADDGTALACALLRMTVRAFYPTEHILVVDALIKHSTLPDYDLAYVIGMQVKSLRKVAGKLKEDGLLSVHSRLERRADGSGVFQTGSQAGKQRMTNRDWYYLNYHRAIDSIKYRIYKLSKYVESQGSSSVEKKHFECAQCGAKWDNMQILDNFDPVALVFRCNRCQFELTDIDEAEQNHENESMKRLNSELSKLLALMQEIDASRVVENDFDMALSKQKPIERGESQPGSKKETVDLPNRNLQSTKGLDIKPEKIAVQVQDDEDVKRENAEAEAAARREREARQNALPEWIAKSTVSGDITTVGAKEERLRQERELNTLVAKEEDGEEKKVLRAEDDVMASYWANLAREREEEAAAAAREEEEEDDDDDDEADFEDVDEPSTSRPTEVIESSNATDDEPDAKRQRVETHQNGQSSTTNGVAVDTPAASDEDEDLEFEEV